MRESAIAYLCAAYLKGPKRLVMKTEENHILQTLPKKEREILLPELELATLILNQVLSTAHAEIEYGCVRRHGAKIKRCAQWDRR